MSITIERLNSQFRKELSKLLTFEAKGDNLSSVTITEVRVTRDLSFATIFYIVPEYLKGKIESSLERAKGYLRSELARRVQCRKMPELIFKYDEALEYGNHINSILNNLNIPTEED